MPGLGNYRSGGHNKKLARETALRYLEYKPLKEIDPTCTSKRAQKVIRVYDEPQEKEDGRGRGGKYIDKQRPLIAHTANFSGTRAELFNSWGVYDNYKEKFPATESQANALYTVNPLRPTERMKPGEAKYCSVLDNKERDSLETTLNSMQRCGEIEWSVYYVYTPTLETYEGAKRILSRPELLEENQNAYNTVCEESKKNNCVLKPELYYENMIYNTSSETYNEWRSDYYQNGWEIGTYEATPAQALMYDNYRTFIRQLTVYTYNENSDEYCPVEEIPNEYDIFTDFTYSSTYKQLDKQWRYLLCWDKVWKALRFSVIDEDAIRKYLDAYSKDLGSVLFQEYIQYMDSQLKNDTKQSRIYFPPQYVSDYLGLLSKGEYKRLFPLRTSKSACELHDKLKKAYGL